MYLPNAAAITRCEVEREIENAAESQKNTVPYVVDTMMNPAYQDTSNAGKVSAIPTPVTRGAAAITAANSTGLPASLPAIRSAQERHRETAQPVLILVPQ